MTQARAFLLATCVCVLGGEAFAQTHPFYSPTMLPHAPNSLQPSVAPAYSDRFYQRPAGPSAVYPRTEYGLPPHAIHLPSKHAAAPGCSHVDLCVPCPCYCWRAEMRGLIMTWEPPNFGQLSFDDTNLLGQELSTHTETGDWFGGAEFRLGRQLSADAALEVTYWGIYPNQQEATVLGASIPGNLNTVLDFSPLNIGATNVNTLFDASQAHRLQRDFGIHNVEVNLVRGNLACGRQCGFAASYAAGLRYFQFREGFAYASADGSPVFGADPANEAHYEIDVENHLIGLQFGLRTLTHVRPRLAWRVASSFGVYGNYLDHHSRIYNVNGTAVVGPGNPLVGQPFDISSDKSLVSFLGELETSLLLQLPCQWTASLGYRVMAVSGVAWATDQIPDNFADLPGVAEIDANATMVLHGAYLGVWRKW